MDEPVPLKEDQLLPAFVQQIPVAAPETNTEPNDLDELIRKRLQTLQQDRHTDGISKSTDTDIAIRVANLKGLQYNSSNINSDPTLLLSTDKRTDEEKVQDLVKQFMAETNLDEAADPIRDIERRLAILKGSNRTNEKTRTEPNADDEDDDETKIKKLVTKYLDDAALPVADDDGASGGEPHVALSPEEKEYLDSIDTTNQQEELPWCTICNEDANLRYEGDLFCKACYKEIKEDE